MKTIELEDDLYRYIASQTQDIGESASDILRRLLALPTAQHVANQSAASVEQSSPVLERASEQNRAEPQVVVSSPSPVIEANPTVSAHQTVVASNLPGSIEQLIKEQEFKNISVSVTKFIQILSVLYAEHPTEFEAATEIKGRKRIYFAKSEKALLSAGSTTKPRKIEHTPFWVITNTNTGRKRNIITQLMAEMGYPHALIDAVSQSI